VEDARSASSLARALLEDELPRRWAHTQGVARQAAGLHAELDQDAALVEAAAWLHDVGYAAPLVASGFHPLDGARYLRDQGFGDRRLWTLVARHTCAEIEARARGLGDVLAEEFPSSEVSPHLLAALTYCDMTTGPDGTEVDVEERITEILARYSPEDVVHRAIAQAAPTLRRQVSEIAAKRGAG
jgi:hypothetical protein